MIMPKPRTQEELQDRLCIQQLRLIELQMKGINLDEISIVDSLEHQIKKTALIASINELSWVLGLEIA